MVNCNYENFGCGGGYLMTTIDYLQVEGLVSRECVPYAGVAQQCSYRCAEASIPMQRHYCKLGSLKVMTAIEEIQQELRDNGPLMMGLMIFEDFLSYESGIYKQTTGEIVGGHAMKLLGYGEHPEEGLYWLM